MLNTTLAKIALGGAKFEMKWGNLTAGSIISFIPIIIIYSILFPGFVYLLFNKLLGLYFNPGILEAFK